MTTKRGQNSVIGYWLPEKKVQKFNLPEFEAVFRRRGYDLVKLDLDKPLDSQGPFCLLFHKCTEILIKANEGDQQSIKMVSNLETYLRAHPEVPIVDSLDKIRKMLDRYRTYLAIRNNPRLTEVDAFVPNSIELTSDDPKVNISILKEAGVNYPFVSKPSVAHGSAAHEMAVIFNDKGVADCRPPSVAQTFVNHNAILYKLFCLGDQYTVQERPSLKNFYSLEDKSTIFFSSATVSKSDSTSSLCSLDADDPMQGASQPEKNQERFKVIADTIREELGLDFCGIDVVIENETGRYAIIDVNYYPGYENYPNLMESIVNCLEAAMRKHANKAAGDS